MLPCAVTDIYISLPSFIRLVNEHFKQDKFTIGLASYSEITVVLSAFFSCCTLSVSYMHVHTGIALLPINLCLPLLPIPNLCLSQQSQQCTALYTGLHKSA